MSFLRNIRSQLFLSSSIPNLAIFRILFGGVMFYEMGRLIWTVTGKFRYIDPVFHFTYPGLSFIKPLPEEAMYSLFFIASLSALFLSIGFLYRYASIILFMIYSYLLLIDVSFWNNHYYMYALLAFFFVITNTNNRFSVDSYFFGTTEEIPAWHLYLFRFQVLVVYFYGGISKVVNPDWLNYVSCQSFIENLLSKNNTTISADIIQHLAIIMSWGGMVFDLLIPFMLLWKRTRITAFVFIIMFNVSNHFIFTIGTFPFAMIACITLFFDASTLNRLISFIENFTSIDSGKKPVKATIFDNNQRLTLVFLLLFVSFQLFFPLRHFLYKGNVFWTGEGKLCSWHMMSGSTHILSEKMNLIEKDNNGGIIKQYDVVLTDYLNYKQIRTLGKWPFLVPDFIAYIKDQALKEGMNNIEIYTDIMVSRNKGEYRHIINPMKNMCKTTRKYTGHNEWVLLYKEEGF